MRFQRRLLLSFFLIASLFFISCERDFESEILSQNPASLEVLVQRGTAIPLAGATIKLYKDEASWNAEGTASITRQSDAEGRVLFTNEELGTPGFFYLITTEGAKKVKSKTKYLLLTDGTTLFTVTIT